ncbi:MAG: transcription antitermination factor NusB [Desulfobulbaceae bacterium A2]|nr:MAG: transcription antitermination factor NusB [Desulfobulbaceae bacterium A2]
MGQRRQARELALQFLFQHDFHGQRLDDEAVARDWLVFCRHFQSGIQSADYARSLAFGICHHRREIDALLTDHARNWRLERMTLVDRNILRLAVYELRFGGEVPDRVAINEALEIARRYGTDDSVPFINGVLDAVRQDAAVPGSPAAT